MTIEDLVLKLRAPLAGRADIAFAMLYGSAVTRGVEHARDVDLAVAWVEPASWMKVATLAMELEPVVGREVDVVDLADASTLLRWEVARAGRLVLAHSRDSWISFMARVPIEYADIEPFLVREGRGLRRVLAQTRWSASTS